MKPQRSDWAAPQMQGFFEDLTAGKPAKAFDNLFGDGIRLGSGLLGKDSGTSSPATDYGMDTGIYTAAPAQTNWMLWGGAAAALAAAAGIAYAVTR